MITKTLLENEVKKKIHEILLNDLDANLNPGDIKDDISLYEDGIGLDSISIVNLIVLIESTFTINLNEEDLNQELFSSINHLSKVICSKQPQVL